jgi:putative transposase
MANTYSQLYLHAVFAVRNRQSLIKAEFKQELYGYISGIVSNQGQKLLVMNGMPDHVHLLLSCRTTLRMDALIKEVKEHSTRFVNSNGCLRQKFQWQNGYGIFSVSNGDLDRVFAYIRNQEQHHARKNFLQEYREILTQEGIEYDDRYIFNDPNQTNE